MDSDAALRFERHLRALRHFDRNEIAGTVARFEGLPPESANAEIRRLLYAEEAFLVGSGKAFLSSGEFRLPKPPERIADIREAGKRLTELLFLLREASSEGVSYVELDLLARDFAQKGGVTLPVLGYEGFPHS